MSDTSATGVGGASVLPFGRTIEETPGSMLADGKPAERMNRQTSKAWYGVAVAVGIVAVLGGVFGGLGLLQAHYHFLPGSFDWLAKAVECVGNRGPHNAVLWALAGAGLVGVGAIAGGSYKVHQARKAEQAEGSDTEGASEEQEGDPVKQQLEEQHALEAHGHRVQYFEGLLGHNFEKLDMGLGQVKFYQEGLQNSSYTTRHFGEWVGEGDQTKFIPEDRADRNFVVIKDGDGVLKFSGRNTNEQQRELEDYLVLKEYQYISLNFEGLLGDNFEKLDMDLVQVQFYREGLQNSSYTTRYFGKWVEEGDQRKFIPEDRADRNFVVIKDGDGVLKCSERITAKQQEGLMGYLNSRYQYIALS